MNMRVIQLPCNCGHEYVISKQGIVKELAVCSVCGKRWWVETEVADDWNVLYLSIYEDKDMKSSGPKLLVD